MKLVVLLFFLISTTILKAQSIIRFERRPPMRISNRIRQINCSVFYKVPKKSTVYIELRRGQQIIGTGFYSIPKASSKLTNISIPVSRNIRLIPGEDYSYHLYVYAGNRNDWNQKLCRSIIISKVRVYASSPRKQYSNMQLLHNFLN